MSNILLLLVCVLAGILVRRAPFFDERILSLVNKVIIYFFFPAIALFQIPKIELEASLLWLTLSPFLVFGLSFVFFKLFAKTLGLDRDTKAALILTAGISSTSFVGFPIFELLYGAEGLAYGVMLSLGGTILVFNTIGVSTLFFFTEGTNSVLSAAKKTLTFIPFIAFCVALVFNLLGVEYYPAADRVLAFLVAPFSVIALFSIGLQVEFKISKELLKEIAIGQFFKLFIAPFVIYLLVWHFLEIRSDIGRVCILGAGIGSMNAMSILTAEKGLNPQLSILMPAIGIPLSIPLLFLIDQFLK